MHPLIDVAELAGSLDEVHLFDIRWALTDPDHGVTTYRAGHIPGAVFVDLDRDLSAPPGPAGRHPLPTLAEWESTLGRLGLTAGSQVVVYDDAGGSVAARMWWMLISTGHEAVALLDGGYQAWVAAGQPVETGNTEPQPTEYRAGREFTGVAGHDQLDGRFVIDVRAPERYRGDIEPVDPKAGHIPGAHNYPLAHSLTVDQHFQDPKILRQIYGDAGARPVVSCGSGVNACHTALAMVAAGLPLPDVYVGSFSEWSRRDKPVVTGDRP